jgi:hypothetical protein
MMDDTAALAQMARLLVSRQCKSRWAAALALADTVEGQSRLSNAKRLDDKFRRGGTQYVEQVRAEKSQVGRRWAEAGRFYIKPRN